MRNNGLPFQYVIFAIISITVDCKIVNNILEL